MYINSVFEWALSRYMEQISVTAWYYVLCRHAFDAIIHVQIIHLNGKIKFPLACSTSQIMCIMCLKFGAHTHAHTHIQTHGINWIWRHFSCVFSGFFALAQKHKNKHTISVYSSTDGLMVIWKNCDPTDHQTIRVREANLLTITLYT